MTDTTSQPNHETEDRKNPDAEIKGASKGYKAGKSAAHNRWLLLIVGIFTLCAGMLALAMPFVASLTAAVLMGWVLIASGIVGLATAFRRKEGWPLAAAFAFAMLAIVAGVLMLLQPMTGILALTTLVIAYFAANGLVRLYYGVRLRRDGGGWMIAVGCFSLLLAVSLFAGFPVNAALVPGVLLGVDLVLWGALEIAMGLREGRRVTPEP